uniref:G patch domain-containing protein 4 n=1 Tax=Gouania willdenowi TaxID=441366 RepID=A0A8C5E071_GOUWI
MAEGVPEKSRGLKFAEQQLLRHGWEHGKGLGRAENGISEPVKVKVKSNKGGVRTPKGEQFTFQWWDHVFNKASSSLEVETDPVTSLAKAKLYGCFVKVCVSTERLYIRLIFSHHTFNLISNISFKIHVEISSLI